MNSRTVVIGSRESRLAVIQSEMVKDYIEKNNEGLKAELLTMKTTGDIILDRTLDKVGGKGLFVKELDRALLDGRSELSVHSLKDMPMEVPDELPLLAFSKREDPRDALVLPEGVTELDRTKPIGCSGVPCSFGNYSRIWSAGVSEEMCRRGFGNWTAGNTARWCWQRRALKGWGLPTGFPDVLSRRRCFRQQDRAF